MKYYCRICDTFIHPEKIQQTNLGYDVHVVLRIYKGKVFKVIHQLGTINDAGVSSASQIRQKMVDTGNENQSD